MHRSLTAIIAVVAGFAPLVGQANAGEEPYATVKGWTVTALNPGSKFEGCAMAKTSGDGLLKLYSYGGGLWELYVPTNQTSRFGGAILSFDKNDFDTQFGFEAGKAYRELTASDIQHMRNGSQLGVEIVGDPARYWSLSGSAAALLKIEECMANDGRAPVASAATSTSTSGASSARPPANIAPSRPPKSGSTCWAAFAGDYACSRTDFAPEGRFQEVYQLMSNSQSAPTIEIRKASDQDMEVYSVWPGESWQFMGHWIRNDTTFGAPAGSTCIEPAAQQSEQARNALGQDAWAICVR